MKIYLCEYLNLLCSSRAVGDNNLASVDVRSNELSNILFKLLFTLSFELIVWIKEYLIHHDLRSQFGSCFPYFLGEKQQILSSFKCLINPFRWRNSMIRWLKRKWQ